MSLLETLVFKQEEPDGLKRRCTSTKFKTSFLKPGNFNSLNMNSEKEKTHSKKIFNNIKTSINNEQAVSNDFPIQTKKRAMFSIYDKTSQIENLPGAVKRLDIKDDVRSYAKFNESYQAKMKKDYSSKIACVPGNTVI